MIKVFLVEDEFVVREGIKKNVDWAGHGYEFCGDASDGEMAFPMIKKVMPDIVITDIKMPFMDGIELSRLLKKELPSIEIIILSGYEEKLHLVERFLKTKEDVKRIRELSVGYEQDSVAETMREIYQISGQILEEL